MEDTELTLSRRTVVKGAAWSIPVIAAAVAAPGASASGPTQNDTANYYWAPESTGKYTTVDAAASGLAGTFSTQIAYQANPWVNPPEGASLQVIVSFSQPVTITNTPSGGWTQSGTTGSSFTFVLTPSSFGASLSFDFVGTAAGSITATPSMSLINGGSTTWSSLTQPGSATLVV